MKLLDRLSVAFRRGAPSPETSDSPSAVHKPPSEQPVESLAVWGGIANLQQALAYAPLHRCVALISQVVAQLATGPTLRVVDRENRVVDTPRSRRALRLVRDGPDDVLSPTQYWTQALVDYLVAGNSIHEIVRGADGMPSRLQRMDPWDLQVLPSRSGRRVYQGTVAGRPRTVGAANVIHIRWPLPRYPGLAMSLDGSGTDDLAASPLVLLWPTIDLGLKSDQYVRRFFEGGPEGALQARTIITMPHGSTDEAMKATAEEFIRAGNDQSPAVVKEGTKVEAQEVDPAHNKDVELLRVYQSRDCTRVYGLPAPLYGEQITSWGSGIEELARLAYRFGFRQHLDNVLDPLAFRLLPAGQRFDIDDYDLLRGDAESMSKLAQMLITAEATTKEEVRTLVGLRAEMPEGETVRSVQVRSLEVKADMNGNGSRVARMLEGRP